MIIEIKGVEFENKGAELMLVAIMQRIQQYWPDAEIALSPNKKSPYLKRAKLNAWQKLSLRKSYLDLNSLAYYLPSAVKGCLRSWGIVTEADVDVILDASGFAYSDQWGSDLRINYASSEAIRLAKHGKAYVFMPQAMGPFNSAKTRRQIARGFPSAKLVCARDSESYASIKEACGDFPSLRQYKDFTNVVEGAIPAEYADASNIMCIVPNKNMVNPRNKNNGWFGSYIETLVAYIDLADRYSLRPVILNHEGEEDAALIQRLVDNVARDVQVVEHPDPLVVKGIIQSSRITICSRYHGCISALSAGRPCIGTSWSHKYERLYEEYGASELLVEPNMSMNELESKLKLALDEASPAVVAIQTNASQFKLETERLWEDIKNLVDAVSSTRGR